MASEIDLKFSTLSPSLELENYPGHSIRRLQQIAVAVFMQETEASAVTPVPVSYTHLTLPTILLV